MPSRREKLSLQDYASQWGLGFLSFPKDDPYVNDGDNGNDGGNSSGNDDDGDNGNDGGNSDDGGDNGNDGSNNSGNDSGGDKEENLNRPMCFETNVNSEGEEITLEGNPLLEWFLRVRRQIEEDEDIVDVLLLKSLQRKCCLVKLGP